jgi:predicted aspartyl protease
MQSIRFQPVSNLILIPIKVIGIDGNSFRDIEVVLDTGASITSISTNVASGLGYDILNPERPEEVITGSGVEELSIIEVTALTAIGQTVENIDVMCLDLHPEIHAEGVLGLNFLLNFDVSIFFSKGVIELVSPELDRF